MQKVPIRMRYHICIEIHVDFCSTQDYHIYQAGKISLRMIVITRKWAGPYMAWIRSHRLHSVQIEGLTIKYCAYQSFLQHPHKIFITSTPCEGGLNIVSQHYLPEVLAYCKSSASGTCPK